MPHMDGRNPWTGYPSWNSAPTPPAPASRSGQIIFKRTRSETDDCDDAYSDQSSKDQCSSPGDEGSCQLQIRKKRRGIIEKRRRDRINTSLTELRRLVPTAYEKQGSAKLEKAEILQMTVDHLKMLHTKGYNPLAYESSKFAMDYHNIGFQECINEVNKYLSVEGLDLHDPLRVRLMGHLQNITAQRDFAFKQSPWHPAAPLPPPNASQPYQSTSPLSPGGTHHLPRPPPPPTLPIALGGLSAHHNASLNSSGSLELNSSSSLNTSSSLSNAHSLNSSFENSGNSTCESAPPSSVQSSTSSASTTGRPLTTISSSDGYYLHHNTHQHSMDLYHHHAQHVHQQHPYGQAPTDPSVTSQMKPYRPWGAEVAY